MELEFNHSFSMFQWQFARPPHIVSVAWLFIHWHTCLALYVDPSHFIIISQWQGPCLTCYYTGHLNKLKFSYSSSQWKCSSLRLPIIRVFQKYKILEPISGRKMTQLIFKSKVNYESKVSLADKGIVKSKHKASNDVYKLWLLLMKIFTPPEVFKNLLK